MTQKQTTHFGTTEFLNDVGKALPSVLTLLSSREYFGSPLYNKAYGYYELGGVVCKRIKMIRKNGKERS